MLVFSAAAPVSRADSAVAVAFSAVLVLVMSCPLLCRFGHDRMPGGLLQCNMTYMSEHPFTVKG